MAIEDVEERRTKRREALEKERKAQYELDMEELDAKEAEYGPDFVEAIVLEKYKPGLPTMVIVRTPNALEGKRFRDQVFAKKTKEGADMLASSCVVYPEKDIYKAMCEAFPALHDLVAQKANKLAQAGLDAEGKG